MQAIVSDIHACVVRSGTKITAELLKDAKEFQNKMNINTTKLMNSINKHELKKLIYKSTYLDLINKRKISKIILSFKPMPQRKVNYYLTEM